MRKIIWFDEWQIELFQKWINDIANSGYDLLYVRNRFAYFQKSNNIGHQYLCDSLQNDCDASTIKTIQNYQDYGWYVLTHFGSVTILQAEKYVSVPELFRDPEYKQRTRKPNRLSKDILAIILMVIVGLVFTLIYTNSYLFLLSDIPIIILTILFVFILRSVVRLLYRSLYKKKSFGISVLYNKAALCFAGILVLSLLVFIGLGALYDNSYPAIPDMRLNILRIQDFNDNQKAENRNNGSFLAYYKQRSSILFPNQFILDEQIDVKDMNISFVKSELYESISKSVTDIFYHKLAQAKDTSIYQKLNGNRYFDCLLYKGGDTAKIIAVKENRTYYFECIYYGNDPIQHIICELQEKDQENINK